MSGGFWCNNTRGRPKYRERTVLLLKKRKEEKKKKGREETRKKRSRPRREAWSKN